MRTRGILLAVVAAVATVAVASTIGTAGTSTEHVVNGSFEGSLANWQPFNASLSLVGGGAVGSRAARVTAGRNADEGFSLFPWPRPIDNKAKRGTVYVGRAWIKSDTPGREACLRIREWLYNSVIDSERVCLRTARTWQQFPELPFTANRSGTDIDVYVYRTSGSRGETFDVDGVSLKSGDSTPPDTQITSAPSGTRADKTATIAFSASEVGATFQCSLDSASFAACTSPVSLTGLRDGSHTFRVRAVDSVGNADQSPASVTWSVDTTAPDTTITSAPATPTASTSATIAFASEAGATFQCALDGAAFAVCTSPLVLTGLAEGSHTLAVRAADALGNVDASPATATWAVDRTPPDTTIAAAPAPAVSSALATIAFGASETPVTFECSLDGAAYAACVSPVALTGLADGSHTFSVRALDALGNADQSPATATWLVDTVAPDTAIDGGPDGRTTSRSASFPVSSNENGVTYECRLDQAPFAACTSPIALASLEYGSHTVEVRAKDAAGNVDGSPAARSWTVVPESVETTIASRPSATSRLVVQRFVFSSDVAGAAFECALDGGSYEPCTRETTVYVWNNKHTLSVRASLLGVTDQSPATWSWWVDTPIENGNFEAPLGGWANSDYTVAGWKGFGAAIALVDGGVAGPRALRVSYTTSATMTAYQDPFPVSATLARTYTAGGRVKAPAGKEVCLRLREKDASGTLQTQRGCVTGDGTWQTFPATSIATAQGNQIEFAVHSTGSVAGDTYDVDGLWLDDGAADPDAPAAGPDPVLLGFGDAGACWSAGDAAVGRLLDGIAGTIAILGDTVYNDGLVAEYTSCFDPPFGRFKPRIKPSVGGDHEYVLPGAPGYWDYFGAAAGVVGKGWYSYDLGSWHIVVLNSACAHVGGCGVGSEQHQWLLADLAANGKPCIGAYWAEPRWSSGSVHGSHPNVGAFWSALYQYGAEFVLGGDDHVYERFAPQDPTGKLDLAKGIRQFVVGTGGGPAYTFGTPLPNSEVRNTGTFGLLKLTLKNASYDWQFVPQSGKSFTDSGTQACS
jgi:hypothetical protein